MKFVKILTSFIVFAALISCSSINNLHKYDLTKSKVFFEEIVPVSVRNVEIELENLNDQSDDNDTKNVLADIATEIASNITVNQVREKLNKAVDSDKIAEEISQNMENNLIKFYNIEKVKSISDDYAFITTTTLKELKLVSGKSGTYLRVRSEIQIISRNDGEIVWENIEAENVFLRSNDIEFNETGSSRRMSNILKTIDLATLSEEDIAEAVKAASQEVARLMSESFREAIIESRQKQ